ncbi:MAG TPA: dTDP-4-dehydrorhamnose 3,5-epimerase family protein [Patescibacteria group bacterium]|nr:dTDP-4-dehydrorhamnose 3,5-epimerase family protein [Patescibacteria group bacterium]
MKKNRIVLISPEKIKIKKVKVIKRTIFYDPRGFLVETFDSAKEKSKSIYSYNSVTRPGQARDKDQYHFHKHQKDRFTIVRGTMWILLLDMRKNSSTYGRLEVVEAKGADLKIKVKKTVPVYTITIPEGVYHGIMAPGPGEAELVNHPTKEYNPQDEGRISFKEIKVKSLNNAIFSWDLVKKK